MINKEKFEKFISEFRRNSDNIDTVEEVFPMLCESPIINFEWYCFDELMKAYFTKEGIDWIDYFLFENPEKCYYQDGERIKLETVDDLWTLIEEYRK